MNRVVALASLAFLVACGERGGRQNDVPHFTGDQRGDAASRFAASEGSTARLRILETTDLHVNMEAFDYYRNATVINAGLVRTGTLIRRARAEVPNALLFDNGDLIQGSPLGDWFQKQRNPQVDVHPVFKAMSLLGYDAANIGNHEFNYGLDYLQATLTGARMPYVSANVLKDDGDGDPTNDRPLFQPYVILERSIVADDGGESTIKVGVIGFAPPQILAWDRSNLLGKVTTRDMVDAATALVPEMKANGADIVVAIPHSGISAAPRGGNDENAVAYLAQVPGIDAILCGHAHQVFPSDTYASIPGADIARGTIHGVPVVMAGQWGSHLGVVDLELKRVNGSWQIVGSKAEARAVAQLLTPEDHEPDLRAAVAADHAATLSYLEQRVGATVQPIRSYFSLLGPTLAVRLVQDAQLWYVQKVLREGGDATAALRELPLLSASAPLKAGGQPGNYTDVPAGPLTLRNVADLYVYPNTVKVVKITGAGLRDWLEMSAGAFNQLQKRTDTEQMLGSARPTYNFDQILGVNYAIDVTKPARFDRNGQVVDAAARRIVQLTYQGRPVRDEQEFLVVTNNYRANGGGFFPGLDGSSIVLDPGRESREVLRDYVEAQREINWPLVGQIGATPPSWRILPVKGATNVILRSGPAGAAVVAEAPVPLIYQGTDADGFGLYRLGWR